MLQKIALPLVITGSFMFGLWGLGNIAFSIQGVCLDIFHLAGAENCATGYNSDSLTSPIVSLEFFITSLVVLSSGAALWRFGKAKGERKVIH